VHRVHTKRVISAAHVFVASLVACLPLLITRTATFDDADRQCQKNYGGIADPEDNQMSMRSHMWNVTATFVSLSLLLPWYFISIKKRLTMTPQARTLG
jgi:hypothetical protein